MSWDLVALIQDYEAGGLDDRQIIALFQRLLDEDLIENMEERYTTTAAALLAAGFIHHHTETGDTDANATENQGRAAAPTEGRQAP